MHWPFTCQRSRRERPSLDEPSHDIGQLLDSLIFVIISDRSRYTSAGVVFEQNKTHAIESGSGSCNLHKDINTVLVPLNHTLNAPHLTLNSAESFYYVFFIVFVGPHSYC